MVLRRHLRLNVILVVRLGRPRDSNQHVANKTVTAKSTRICALNPSNSYCNWHFGTGVPPSLGHKDSAFASVSVKRFRI